MSSPPRSHARRTSSVTREGPGNRRTSGAGSGIPVPNTSLRANRLAATQPSYDFLTGGHAGSATPTPVKPLGQSFRQSTVGQPDIGNEDLRAQIKTLQYEVDSLKRDRDLASLRHGKELRDAQLKAEEVFQKARSEDSAKNVPLHKYDALNRSLTEAQDAIVNQKTALEKKLRGAQEAERTAREETEEARNDLASMDRQHKHTIREIEVRLNTWTQTANDLRHDLDSKANTLKATQDRLSQQEAEAGALESEVLRLKAQNGDSETLGVIKRELSDQVAHIRLLEKTNREQTEELKVFRKRGKAVEVVEEEKRVLESKLGLLDAAQKQLREAQLQRQILEDERRSWAAYLENEGTDEYKTPEEVAKALARQRLENAALVQQRGELQAEQLEKDEVIKGLELQRSTIQAEVDSLRSTTANVVKAEGNTVLSTSTTGPGISNDSRTRNRLEKQLSFAKKEVALMREQLRSFDSEEQTYHPDSKFDATKSARIGDLEGLLDESRREMADMTAELSTLEAKLSTSSSSTTKSPLKRSHDTMEETAASSTSPTETEGNTSEVVGQLSRKVRKLQDQLSTQQTAHTILLAEKTATQTQLQQLQHSSRTRILSLNNNPTSAHEAIKTETLRTLQLENRALLARLNYPLPPHHLHQKNDGGQEDLGELAPKATLSSLRLELKAKEHELLEREKRMMRLKQIWAAKTLEFREAVLALLGWKMVWRGDGKFVLSLNTRSRGRDGGKEEEDGDGDGEEEEGEDESFIFDGDKGTMKVSGGSESAFALEVRPLFERWVGGGKEGGRREGGGGGWIPGLMASVLLKKVEGE